MKSTIESEEFVRTWQCSTSVKDAAEKLGIEEKTASARAVSLRRLGVPLRKFHGGQRIDVENLKRIAEECAPESLA